MQILFNESEEGSLEGLSLIGGNIKKFKDNKILWTIGDFESYETFETRRSC